MTFLVKGFPYAFFRLWLKSGSARKAAGSPFQEKDRLCRSFRFLSRGRKNRKHPGGRLAKQAMVTQGGRSQHQQGNERRDKLFHIHWFWWCPEPKYHPKMKIR
jgi:hypothetical protein